VYQTVEIVVDDRTFTRARYTVPFVVAVVAVASDGSPVHATSPWSDGDQDADCVVGR
jgi:hypothetical protein